MPRLPPHRRPVSPDVDTSRETLDLAAAGLAPLVYLGIRHSRATRWVGTFMHRHENALEICYLESGQQAMVVGGSEYLLRGNSVLTFQPGQEHGNGLNPLEKCKLYYLGINLANPVQGCRSLAAPGEERALAEALLTLPRFFAGDRRMKVLLEGLREAATSPGDLRRTEALQHARGFLLLLIACARNQPAEPLSGPIKRVIDHIRSNLSEPLTVDALASVAQLSEQRFHSRFKGETGIPPKEYVLREKVRQAQQLLRAGRPVTDVAFSLGFSSSQYFATVYRRYMGFSPSTHQIRSGSHRRT